jgi:hypothetical protein
MTEILTSLADSPFGKILRALSRSQPEENRLSVQVIQWLMLQSSQLSVDFGFVPVQLVVSPLVRFGSSEERKRLLACAESQVAKTSPSGVNVQLARLSHPFRLTVVRVRRIEVVVPSCETSCLEFSLRFHQPNLLVDEMTSLEIPEREELWRLTRHLYDPYVAK